MGKAEIDVGFPISLIMISILISFVNLFSRDDVGYSIRSFLILPIPRRLIAAELLLSESLKITNLGFAFFFLSYILSYYSFYTDVVLYSAMVLLMLVFTSICSVSFRILVNKSRVHLLTAVLTVMLAVVLNLIMINHPSAGVYLNTSLIALVICAIFILYNKVILKGFYLDYM